ncbi:MAG: hypothetical protein FJ405_08110 [Verrucomicrobia bacterium]|nr:hypothetical protein [Verrucomicrobiota bacterium]
MPKSRPRSRRTKLPDLQATAFLPKADRMERRLREQHELGRAAVEAEKKDGRMTTDAYAAERDLSPHSLRKLKSFARGYYVGDDTCTEGRSSLDELCRLRRKGSGLGLHWGHVIFLLGVEQPAERLRWARLAADGNWSPQRLSAELRKGQPPGSGRPLKPPTNPVEGLAQALREGTRWLARCESVVMTCETARAKCRDAATRKAASELLRLWRSAQTGLAEHSRRLDDVLNVVKPTKKTAAAADQTQNKPVRPQ